MTNISTVYDGILTALGTHFPSKTKIPNPYEPENNPSPFLRDGYGLKFNGSEKEDGEYNHYRASFDFSVVISREVVKTDENTEAMETATKLLLEDVNTLRVDFCNADQIGVGTSVDLIDLSSSSGIEFIQGEKTNFINIEVNFLFSVAELI
jgi:hypothetical protein